MYIRVSNDKIFDNSIDRYTLENKHAKNVSDQHKIEPNLINSLILEEKKTFKKYSVPLWFFVSSLAFFHTLTLLICLSTFHLCLFTVNHLQYSKLLFCSLHSRFSVLPLTYCDTQTIMNRSLILTIECLMLVTAHAFL